MSSDNLFDDNTKGQDSDVFSEGNVDGTFTDKLDEIESMLILPESFKDLDAVSEFYTRYGWYHGFDIRRGHSRRNKNGYKSYVKYECTHAGSTQIQKSSSIRQGRATKSCNCKAHLNVSRRSNGSYVPTTFENNHNHDLLAPKDRHFLKCNRFISEDNQFLLTVLNGAGLRARDAINVVEHLQGGPGNLPFKRKDVHNFFGKNRRIEFEGGDANAALSLLEGMKLVDKGIICEPYVDENNTLIRLFWSDGCSREEYNLFGDALVFDSTYKTNTYRFPLVIFSGVDNNFKTCVFGGAVLSSESEEAYIWLLEKFKGVMGGKQPLTIMTDQDRSMRVAVRKVFPNSRHRLCCWHLEKNCMQKVRKPVFTKDFGELLQSKLSIEDFEAKWTEVTEMHGVTSNDWVLDTYSKKESWCEAYFRGHFTAMMKSSQMAEGVNSIFKLQNRPECKLTELIKYYRQIVARIRVACIEAQQESEGPKPPLRECGLRRMQEYAQNTYSKRIFSFVQSEIYAEQGLLCKSFNNTGNRFLKFTFANFDFEEGGKWDVEIDWEEGTFICDCLGLESEGFPCRHLFSAFKYMHLTFIPSPCILGRWTTEAGTELRRKFMYAHADDNSQVERLKRIFSAAHQEAKRSKISRGNGRHAGKSAKESILNNEGVAAESPKYPNVRDPTKINTRGATKNTKQKCSLCGQPGHKRGRCPTKDKNNKGVENEPSQEFA